MSFTIKQEPITSDAIGRFAVTPQREPASTITFPQATGTVSLGPTVVASGIITMSALTAGSGSGSVSVTGLTETDIVMTSIDTDASGSTFFYVKVDPTEDTISFRGLTVSGSTYAKCHYTVLRTL